MTRFGHTLHPSRGETTMPSPARCRLLRGGFVLAMLLAVAPARASAAGPSSNPGCSYGASNDTCYGYDALASENGGNFNSAFGYQALYDNATGTYNTATGQQALIFNTTGSNNTASGMSAELYNSTGSANTASGADALYSNTTGSDETATGYESLFSDNNTSGPSLNTADGYQVLYSDTGNSNAVQGIYNTGIGYRALFANTTGTADTATGMYALASNTTGGENSASGVQALNSNTTGSSNAALGYQALYANTTGGNNTAVGDEALDANTTGSGNDSSGLGALSANTTGSNNTASGTLALYSNTTGSDETATGYGALAADNNTSGISENTADGYQTLSHDTGNSNSFQGVSNTGTGYEALYSTTTGSADTASGTTALYSNTTGTYNAAYGTSALYANSTGSENTAVGSGALDLNSTGSFDTASGTDALLDNTTGGDNTATGGAALIGNTTGQYNTASGAYALHANTTGSGDTATGYEALYADNNTSGNSDNTAVGYETLLNDAGNSGAGQGIFNTGAGYQALYSNTTGYFNTASGYLALYSNTTGGGNTASGLDALSSNTTGYFNTALGVNAGTVGTGNTTGSNNTFIGYDASTGTSTQLTNATAIGANAVVSESNALVLGGAGTDVGIGTATPSSPLTVAGVIQSTSGGIKFPDGTTQTTAATLTVSPGAAGNYLRSNGTSWTSSAIQAGDLPNLSAQYVDLTSSQLIAGTKTFSSTIAGSISGNAGTVTNGVYTTGSYADPSWLTALSAGKITGVLGAANGGTGLSSPGASGNFLQSNGSGGWSSAPITASEIPNLSGSYVDLSSSQTVGGSKTFSSKLTVNGLVDSTTGGIEFPDGTIQTTASSGGGGLPGGQNGQYLRYTNGAWGGSDILAGDIPAGSTNYIQNGTSQQAGANFNISGNGTLGGTLSVAPSGGSGTLFQAGKASTSYGSYVQVPLVTSASAPPAGDCNNSTFVGRLVLQVSPKTTSLWACNSSGKWVVTK